jgi:SNF2 family DNA or RNA helicase
VRLISPNAIEEKTLELQSRKKELVQELVHTDTSILKQLSKEDLLEMLLSCPELEFLGCTAEFSL